MAAPRTVDREEVARLLAEGVGISEIARRLGKDRSGISLIAARMRLEATQARLKAQARPVQPDTPDGFEVRQVSTGYDANGNVTGQWVGARIEGQHTDNVPEGHIVKGLSTLVDEQGKTRAQWI